MDHNDIRRHRIIESARDRRNNRQLGTPQPQPPRTEHEDSRTPELESIELLRYAVKLFDGCREDFNQTYPAEDLLKLARMMRRCEWDITPDRWTPAQVRDAIALNKVPRWATDDSGATRPIRGQLIGSEPPKENEHGR